MNTVSPVIEWGVASCPLAGQSVSGDLHVVAPHGGGVLVGVVDGLGHGPEAVAAARCAIATLQTQADADVVSLVHSCHVALLGTRGVVMSLMSFHAHTDLLTWVGVGDVETVVLHAGQGGLDGREVLPLRGGVIGYQLPQLRASTLTVARDDLVIFATDGLRRGFLQDAWLAPPLLHPSGGCQYLADVLLARYGKTTDDALVLVARYRGTER